MPIVSDRATLKALGELPTVDWGECFYSPISNRTYAVVYPGDDANWYFEFGYYVIVVFGDVSVKYAERFRDAKAEPNSFTVTSAKFFTDDPYAYCGTTGSEAASKHLTHLQEYLELHEMTTAQPVE